MKGGEKMPNVGGDSVFIGLDEAAAIVGVSRSTIWKAFKTINERLEKNGKIIFRGKCNRQEFYNSIGYKANN